MLGSQPFGSELVDVVHHGEVNARVVREVGGMNRANEPGAEKGETVHDHAPCLGPTR